MMNPLNLLDAANDMLGFLFRSGAMAGAARDSGGLSLKRSQLACVASVLLLIGREGQALTPTSLPSQKPSAAPVVTNCFSFSFSSSWTITQSGTLTPPGNAHVYVYVYPGQPASWSSMCSSGIGFPTPSCDFYTRSASIFVGCTGTCYVAIASPYQMTAIGGSPVSAQGSFCLSNNLSGFISNGVNFNITSVPSAAPTSIPSSAAPTSPTFLPTSFPSTRPTLAPSLGPTSVPTESPSLTPSQSPTNRPSLSPTSGPTPSPTALPTLRPTMSPSSKPTSYPTSGPTTKPTLAPSSPTIQPSLFPTTSPTAGPTAIPTIRPTFIPTSIPTFTPSSGPTLSPTSGPTWTPTTTPTTEPTSRPTKNPSSGPTVIPTLIPTFTPTFVPTWSPTSSPTFEPTLTPTKTPTTMPTSGPSSAPTLIPTTSPTPHPSTAPTAEPSTSPSKNPSSGPTIIPTGKPSAEPTSTPTNHPSSFPTEHPTTTPTLIPTSEPSLEPSLKPTFSPTSIPTTEPSFEPSTNPTSSPSTEPSFSPSAEPTDAPSASPTSTPTIPQTILSTNLPSREDTIYPKYPTLALSVKDPAHPALTGNPRAFKIINTGSHTAFNVSFFTSTSSAANPQITTHLGSLNSCGDIAPQETCTLTITPNTIASALPYQPYFHDLDDDNSLNHGIILSILGANTNELLSRIIILTYGSIYQEGFVYSIDDTQGCTNTPCEGSVGGKVFSLFDQAVPCLSTGPQQDTLSALTRSSSVWSSSSNGVVSYRNPSATNNAVSYDTIPGINELSSSCCGPFPSFSNFQSFFASSYSNPNPFNNSSFEACDGLLDGHCNTANILNFYNQFQTHFYSSNTTNTALAGPTSLDLYAAGLCAKGMGKSPYINWYLPAACEMAFDENFCAPGTQSISALKPLIGSYQVNRTCGAGEELSCSKPDAASTSCEVAATGITCLAGNYWSSTQMASNSQKSAWPVMFDKELNVHGFFGVSCGKNVNSGDKANQYGVRCARNLTP